MKVAIIADIHGNLPALEAVLADIEKQDVDKIVCAGDVCNPFKESKDVWEKLKKLNIPTVRGNHEDYLIKYFFNYEEKTWSRVNVKALKCMAEYLGKEVVGEFRNLPFSMTIQGPKGNDIYICHASPVSNKKTCYYGIDNEMESALKKIDASVIVGAHNHIQWNCEWNEKSLVLAGSLGMPLNDDSKAQYLILTFRDDAWSFEHKRVEYDNEYIARSYLESGFLHMGNPISWLFYQQMLTGSHHLSPCLNYIAENKLKPKTELEWQDSVICYFKEVNCWDSIKHVI